MPARLTLKNLTAHDKYFKSQGSPTIYDNKHSTGRQMASKRTSVTVPAALNAKNVDRVAPHLYPEYNAKELAEWALRNGPSKVNFRGKQFLKTIKANRALVAEYEKNAREAKEGESDKRKKCDKDSSCTILGGKKTRKKRRTKRHSGKTRRGTKRRVKKHGKIKSRIKK